MTFEVLSCYGTDAVRWQSFYDRLPWDRRAVHFSPAYARVQTEAGYDPHCAVFECNRGIILYPFALRQIEEGLWDMTSLPGGGGAATDADDVWVNYWSRFFDAFAEWRGKFGKIVTEFCSLHPQSMSAHDADVAKSVVLMPCPPNEDEFRDTRRHCIRKAVERGVVVMPQRRRMSLFFGLYYQTMDRRGAARRWRLPFNYFEAFEREMPDHCIMLEARQDHRTVGAALMLVGGSWATYAFAGNSLAVDGASDLMVVEAAKIAAACGAQYLNLGGGATGNGDDTLLAYKRSFSKRLAMVYISRRIFDHAAYDRLCDGAGPSDFFPAYRGAEAAA